MAFELTIEPGTGALRIGDLARLTSGQSKADVSVTLDQFARDERDHGNGYEWLSFGGLTFGGRAASLSLCFFNDRLHQVAWNAHPPDGAMEGGWPTRAGIDEEVAFVRRILGSQIGFEVSRSAMTFPWGEVWSEFDPKGFLAANGLRYAGQ